ncbi:MULTISPECIES: ABC transporter ATP-binding protein [Dickeya]|uniref:Nickel transport ATP-binding protein NikE (TC 3.A.1.5.3) n=1 Tax=Dickeya aquatica TaxID=1401087 RepID=A0A375A8W1_9GAMM|nr:MULTISPECIES: dipeptide/oligopeptide/nickel ABC transporter ATP-binding protein [Dickeya]SLM62552.1 Nickel transport ATP-binding protein NikE (TC 3.A.1.5.3) [Dickeya aquatica]
MWLEVRQLEKRYPVRCHRLFGHDYRTVINGVTFSLARGDCLGLIGASGSGKSTLARLIGGLERPDSGGVWLAGEPVLSTAPHRARISGVFQDYRTSINPTMTVQQAIAEPLRLSMSLSPRQLAGQVAEILITVGLSPQLAARYPHELSGGQIQRVCIGRAIAGSAQLLILDEAISALDVCSQVQILDLLAQLRQRFALTCVLITHDIQAAVYLCNRFLFLHAGAIVEEADVAHLGALSHPVARRLLHAVQVFD